MEALELTVDEGRPANAGRFFHLGVDLLDLLDELSDLPITWRLEELRTGSAIARVGASGKGARRTLRLAYDSLGAVQAGGELSHDAWNPDAVAIARRFVGHARPEEDEENWVAPRLRLVHNGKRQGDGVALTPELGERLDVLQPLERRMPGSVRGELVGLNVSRGNRASLRLPNRRVVRIGFDSGLRAALKDALYQEVELRGLVKQDAEGRVFHVLAEEVARLVRPDVNWSDLWGMDPGFTGDLGTDEWLEANRGEA